MSIFKFFAKHFEKMKRKIFFSPNYKKKKKDLKGNEINKEQEELEM